MHPSSRFAADIAAEAEPSSTELQLLQPFVTCCGRFPGVCPLTDRNFIADIYCPRCSCIAAGSFSAR